MDTWNPQIIVHPLWCPKLSPLRSPISDYNRCIQLVDRIKNTNILMKTYRVQIWNHGTRAQSVKHEEQQDVAKMINTIVDDRQHAPNNLKNYYMIDLIHSLPSPLPTAGNYSHMDGGDMEGWWSGDGDDDGVDFPSPEAKSAPRLALPRKHRGGGGSATKK
jgi:hypothetical protein